MKPGEKSNVGEGYPPPQLIRNPRSLLGSLLMFADACNDQETSNIDQPDSRRCSSVGGSALTDQIIEDDICGNPWESDKLQSFETLLLQWTTLRPDEIPA